VLIPRINAGTGSKPDRGVESWKWRRTGACFRGKVVFGALATLVSQRHLAKAVVVLVPNDKVPLPAKAVTSSIDSLSLLSGE
jgi:hypothetical protein